MGVVMCYPSCRFFDFSYIVGSSYLVEMYCWHFIERHRKIWNAKAQERQEKLQQLQSEQNRSSRRLQAMCSLCYGGDIPSPTESQMMGDLPLVPSQGRMTCEQASLAVASIPDGSVECTTVQISGYVHCGCPSLPPKNELIACDFCADGTFEGIDYTKEVPEFPNLAFIRDQRTNTCFDIVRGSACPGQRQLCPILEPTVLLRMSRSHGSDSLLVM